jgi:Xaa-Pro aminopeptidase
VTGSLIDQPGARSTTKALSADVVTGRRHRLRPGGPARLSSSERFRRAEALQAIVSELELDVLLLAANDYRGHKGALRWVADYNLAHRSGYAVVTPGEEPELLLPLNLAAGRAGGWNVKVRYARDTSSGIPERLRELGPLRRIGVVGLGQVMKVDDYLALREAFPDAELVDAQQAFERVRARKSPEEQEGLREAAAICDDCFDRLPGLVRPGVTERELGAAMYERAYALGGEDPLFLSMYPESPGDGTVGGKFGPPGDRVLRPGDVHIFSFELIGPMGFWVELARMIVLGEPTELQVRMNAAVAAGMEAGRTLMRPGKRPDEVQRAILDAVAAHGAWSSYWSGHGLGQDVIEEPWLGLEIVQNRDVPSEWVLEEGMALSNHPYVVDLDERAIGYMADSYLVRDGGGEVLSRHGLDLYVV